MGVNARHPVAILVLATLVWLTPRASHAHQPLRQPNVLIIVSDDQPADTMAFMPRTQRRIFDQGVTFSHGYVTTPLCCPSRASILTGMYAHNHGVRSNSTPLHAQTLVQRLHANGYYTGLVGKYLNSWDGSPRPEFDYWVSHGAGEQTDYHNPRLNVQGTWVEQAGYLTFLERDYALDFLKQANRQAAPFFLLFTPRAPHLPALPAPGDETLYPQLSPYRPPSYNEADMRDKPPALQKRPRFTEQQRMTLDSQRRRTLQNLHALDLSVDALVTRLEQQGKLDQTLIIYLSDNGFLWGEHRLVGKRVVYEESIRVPFGLRYPPLVPSARHEARLVANIDIAPTIYELTGLPRPLEVDGQSLVPLLRGSLAWRTELVFDGPTTKKRFDYQAMHTDRYVYVELERRPSELYDLADDPFQLENRIADPAYLSVQDELATRLQVQRRDQRVDDLAGSITYNAWQGVTHPAALNGGMRRSDTPGETLTFATPISTTAITLLTYQGPDQGQVQVTIDGVDWGVLDLYTPTVQYQTQHQYDQLPEMRHTITLTVLGTRHPASTGAMVTLDGVRAGALTLDERAAEVGYSGWAGAWTPGAFRGGYRSATMGTVALSFTGTTLTWLTARGPASGQAELRVDGRVLEQVDLYAPTWEWQYEHVITGLGPGPHELQLRVLGTANAAAVGSTIVVDAFIVPTPVEP